MGIFGVVICSSILMGAFGIQESIGYQDTWLYGDLKPAAYTITVSPDYGYSWAYDIAREYNGQLVMQTDAEITGRDDSRLFTLTVVDEGNLLRFHDTKGNYITLPDYGAMISEKAADTLGISVGDMVSFRLPGEKKEYSVNIAKIHKTPEAQGIVISRKYYESLHGEFDPKIIYTNMTPPDTLAVELKEVSGVNSREKYVAALKRNNASTAELVYVIVIIGIIIGFVAMYNTGVLSFAEKMRDVATLKVLGFPTNKIRWILQQQNLFITGVGTLIGIGVGLVLIRVLMNSLDPSGDFLVDLSATPYLLAILFSFVVSVAVNGIISTKVKSINMVEALQGVK
jgi:putative ABC transport system permease protein